MALPDGPLTGAGVPRVGLGLAALGRPAYITSGRAGDLPSRRSVDTMETRTHDVLDAAWDAGVRYVDCARSYGLAERFLGSWLASHPGRRERLVVGSKWGYRYVGEFRMDAAVHEIKEHSVAMLDEQWPQTLEALGGPPDVYLVHSATVDSPALRARPNEAHHAVVRLERSGVPVRVITQNVDGLHQLAGLPERKVLELHGTARTVVCTGCHARSAMTEALERVRAGEEDPRCPGCGGILKSATVMFGQALDPVVLADAVGIAKASEVFIAVGTSLQVQPAASLASIAARHGARLIIVNAEPTPYDGLAERIVREPIGTALPALLGAIAAEAAG